MRPSQHKDTGTHRLVWIFAALVLAIALLDLAGWFLHVPLLTSAIRGYATMKPNTALCLGLLALALLLDPGPESNSGPSRRFSATGLSTLALFVGALTLLEYATHRNLSIDQWLIAVPADRFIDTAGRMSFGTSVCLVLTSAGLLLRDRSRLLSTACVLTALTLSVAGLVGFLFQAGPLIEVPWLRSLAVHTGLSVALLQMAILASRPGAEPFHSLTQHWHRDGRRRYLLFAVTVLPLALGLPVLLGMRFGRYDARFALALLVVLLMLAQTTLLWIDNRSIGRVEARLRASEEYSARILQSIGDAVIVTGPEGRVARMNLVAERLTGWPLAEAAGKPLTEIFHIVHEYTRLPVENPVETVLRSNATIGLANHTLLLHRDGTENHIEDSCAPIREDDGSIAGVVLVFRDVNERKASEQRIRSADDRLLVAFETAKLGSWELELDTEELRASSSCKANYGLSPESPFTYADLFHCIHPDDLDTVRAAIAEAIATRQIYRAEYRIAWPDGSPHWIVATGRTLYNELGTPLRMVGATLDVTERHQTTAALIQSEKLAAVGRLASSIAHEINNPLESVTNLIYLARQEAASPQVQEYLDSAERELRRVSAISSQTLRFYKQTTSPKLSDPAEMLENVLSIYQGKLLNSPIRVEVRFRSQRPVFCFDGEVRQVLGNLVGNAIDALSSTEGRLLLRTRTATSWATGRPGVAITVADTGSGISPATLQRIFEPFFTTKGMAGTGLGLWISDEIIRRHQGTFRVRSSQSPHRHGTVFTLFLPFAAATRA